MAIVLITVTFDYSLDEHSYIYIYMYMYIHSPLRNIVEVHGKLCEHWTLLLILLLSPVQHLTYLHIHVHQYNTTQCHVYIYTHHISFKKY